MRGVSDQELLAVWEQGESQSILQRTLLLLAVACPDRNLDELADLSIGQRDDLLFALREKTFGPSMEGIATCPACSARVELSLNVADLHTGTLPATTGPFDIELSGYTVKFRLPNTHDLAHAAHAGEVSYIRQHLLAQCIEAVTYDNTALAPTNLPVDVIDMVLEKMAALDPQADIQLALVCPDCKHSWQVTFDIASYFWQEISTRAQHILREVHLLARAYHWSEAEILALSSQRRHRYLEMVSTHE